MKTLAPSDPHAGYLAQRTEIDAAVRRVLESGTYILGAEVAAFEEEWAAYLGAHHAVGVGNGTDAIELALRALGIGAGDLVITTSNTAVATVAAIELSGATPLLVDVEEETLTISPETLAAVCNANVRAVIPVHLYGQPAPMSAILSVAKAHALRVIEDCAQAHGAMIGDRKVGMFGDLAAFSFYPTKNLAAFGDGGAVVTNDAALETRLRELRAYGWRERYISESTGMNTRLDEMQAAILRVRLQRLEEENARRIAIAGQYRDSLGRLPLHLPAPRAGERHVYHQFTIRLEQRDALREHLRAASIAASILYPLPIHLQPAYRGRIAIAGDLAVTERAARELLCLPIHPWLEDDDVRRITEAIHDWFKR